MVCLPRRSWTEYSLRFHALTQAIATLSQRINPFLSIRSKLVLKAEGFVKATACSFEIEGFMRAMAYYAYYIYTTLRQFINHQDFLLNNLETHQMISQ